MKPKQFVILMAVIIFFSVVVRVGAEEKKTFSWITEAEAALPAMKTPRASTKGLPEPRNKPFQVKILSMAGPVKRLKNLTQIISIMI